MLLAFTKLCRRMHGSGVLAIAIATSVVASQCDAADRKGDSVHIRVAAYNVSFLSEASAAEIGEMLKKHDFDIVGLTEVPQSPATSELAKAMGAKYHVTGTISSGTSKDKLKAIVSRTPLGPMTEINCSAAQGGFVSGGESVTHADTEIEGIKVSIYCPHISDGIVEPMQKWLNDAGFQSDKADAVIAMGDFNANLDTPQMKLIQMRGFRDTWSDHQLDVRKAKTYDLMPGRGPKGEDRDEGVIDHIMIKGKRIKAVDGGIIAEMNKKGKPMSDHALIWAELVLPLKE